MRLSRPEFNAMNTSARRLVQRTVEFPLFKRMGLVCEQRDVLESWRRCAPGAMWALT